jgi:hypothetical protein
MKLKLNFTDFRRIKRLRVQKVSWYVGPCHHGMTCPQVADGGESFPDMEGKGKM